MTQVWILTFNRPHALTRLVKKLQDQGAVVNIFSNHPEIRSVGEPLRVNGEVIINTLNSAESNSWCARSWNTMYMKCFDKHDEGVFIQDDTDISDDFVYWLSEQKKNYDFIWGPAGDQFHYIRKSVLQKTGWWDERYLGCYCGDADYVKRVYMRNDASRLSIDEEHNWGGRLNTCGLRDHVITTYEAKTIDPNYDNQHWQMERELSNSGRTDSNNPVLKHSQKHYRDKWGIDLDIGQSTFLHQNRQLSEIDWYPWFSKKHNFGAAWLN